MTNGPFRFNSESGRKAGQRSARARRERRLTLERVERELPLLENPADAERWLTRLAMWGAAGMLPGTVLSGCVRSVEIWLKVKEAEASFEVVEELRADVRALREERDRLARDLELTKAGIR